jgi:SAM-dependent methyltransferase
MNAPNQWQLSGNAAERYERVLVPAIFAPWAADLVSLADLRPGERVLDVACGTGVVARLAGERVGAGGQITGLDLNEGMLEVARSLPSPAGAAAVVWVQGSALAMRLPDASFDVVLCQQGVQFFPDRPLALREMIRVLVPNGRVLASVWEGPTPYATAMWNAVERHVGADAAATLRKSRAGEGTPTPHDAGGIPRGEDCAADTHGQNTSGWRFRLAASRGDPSGRYGPGAQRQYADGLGGGRNQSVTAVCRRRWHYLFRMRQRCDRRPLSRPNDV